MHFISQTCVQISNKCIQAFQLGFAVLVLFGSSAFGQIQLLPDSPPAVILNDSNQVDNSQQRIAKKPAANAAKRRKQPEGVTYVALAAGLTDIFDGREPDSIEELKALELQQSKVAKVIEQVTVNIQQGTAQGSGVIITQDGYVLTAAHVAGGADREATVVMSDGRRLRARTLGLNRNKDAGLIKIEELNPDHPRGWWPHASLGRSEGLRVGQWCIASGHPGGWKAGRGSVIRVGRIHKMTRSRGEQWANTLFTDCALIGGDSGGPLFTLEGRLIGIHSRIGTRVTDNMHVPVDVFNRSWDRMVRGEVWGVLPGFAPAIGVTGKDSNAKPLLESVDKRGAAAAAGVEAGDVVLKVDETEISTFGELQKAVRASMPGDVIVLTVDRNGQIIRIPVTVGVANGS